MTEEQLQRALWPRPVRYYQQTTSTNDRALEWLRAGAAAGAVVVADEQLSGRGRMGRAWHTPAGRALALSIVLQPGAHVLERVGMLGALAVCELIDGLGVIGAGIKWPNDVQINGRKVCGVLPEAAWEDNQLLGVVLGIGVNITVDFHGMELAASAVSLADVADWLPGRLDLLAVLLERIDAWNIRLESPVLVETWKTRLTTIGQHVILTGGSGEVRGTAENVDERGALMVRDVQGALHRVLAGDIALG